MTIALQVVFASLVLGTIATLWAAIATVRQIPRGEALSNERESADDNVTLELQGLRVELQGLDPQEMKIILDSLAQPLEGSEQPRNILAIKESIDHLNLRNKGILETREGKPAKRGKVRLVK